jgi:hypothetical protein
MENTHINLANQILEIFAATTSWVQRPNRFYEIFDPETAERQANEWITELPYEDVIGDSCRINWKKDGF